MTGAAENNREVEVSEVERMFVGAVAHHQAGRLKDAESLYGEVLRHEPGYPDALHLSGLIAAVTGRLTLALERFEQARRLTPNDEKLLGNLFLVQCRLGIAHAVEGRPAEALPHLEQALALKPGHPEVVNNLGVVLQELGRLDEAILRFGQALTLRPDYAEAMFNLGAAHQRRGEAAEAMAHYQSCLRLRPQDPGLLCKVAIAFQLLGRTDEAVGLYEATLSLEPNFPEALNNLGCALQELGRLDEAMARYKQAQTLAPDYAEAHLSEAIVHLLKGDFAAGWPKYEWRWLLKDTEPHGHEQPLWDGSRLDGKTILIHCEQGLGDCIQFIRYARLVKELGGTVVVFCPKALARLFRHAPGIDQLVSERSAIPPCDCRAPLLSLPLLLGTTPATVPADVPYLRPEPALVAAWRQRLAAHQGFKVGLVWAGDSRRPDPKSFATDRRRSMRLEQMVPLGGLPGLSFISLQKGEPAAEASRPPFALADWSRELEDFADTAALIANLDLVISVDTSVAHLAGALARPVWLLSRFDGCWRWLLDRDDSPWYPGLRIFRQPRPGDWASVVEQVRGALAERR